MCGTEINISSSHADFSTALLRLFNLMSQKRVLVDGGRVSEWWGVEKRYHMKENRKASFPGTH